MVPRIKPLVILIYNDDTQPQTTQTRWYDIFRELTLYTFLKCGLFRLRKQNFRPNRADGFIQSHHKIVAFVKIIRNCCSILKMFNHLNHL